MRLEVIHWRWRIVLVPAIDLGVETRDRGLAIDNLSTVYRALEDFILTDLGVGLVCFLALLEQGCILACWLLYLVNLDAAIQIGE